MRMKIRSPKKVLAKKFRNIAAGVFFAGVAIASPAKANIPQRAVQGTHAAKVERLKASANKSLRSSSVLAQRWQTGNQQVPPRVCSAKAHKARIIYAPGSYNANNWLKRRFQKRIVNSLAAKGYTVEKINWARRTLLMNHLSKRVQSKAAREIANAAVKSWAVGEDVYMLGHSAAANAVIKAMEILAREHPEVRIKKVVLVGASISSNRDLSLASRVCSKKNFINIYNPFDVVVNVVGTGIVGQAGGARSLYLNAGVTGFRDAKLVTNVRVPTSLLHDQHEVGLQFARKKYF